MILVLPVLLVQKAPLVHKEYKVQRAIKETKVIRVQKALPVLLVPRVQQVQVPVLPVLLLRLTPTSVRPP